MAVANPVTVCAVSEPNGTTMRLVESVTVGGSFTGVMVRVKALVARSMPPLSVPPSSCATTVTIAVPFALAAGVKVSVPLEFTVGSTAKSALLLVVTR